MVQVFRPVALTLTLPHDLRSKTLLCGFDSGGGCGEKGLGPRCPGECITPGFPFCCSCRPRCFPIPSVPQLDLSSVYLSSPGSSTILKCDEFCKINSVWLNIYKLSFFTDTGKGIYFKFFVPRWGSWASKKTKKKPQLPITYIKEYMDIFSTVQFLVDIREETYYKLFTWPHYWKWYFIVIKLGLPCM